MPNPQFHTEIMSKIKSRLGTSRINFDNEFHEWDWALPKEISRINHAVPNPVLQHILRTGLGTSLKGFQKLF